jgi:hypothetical protein
MKKHKIIGILVSVISILVIVLLYVNINKKDGIIFEVLHRYPISYKKELIISKQYCKNTAVCQSSVSVGLNTLKTNSGFSSLQELKSVDFKDNVDSLLIMTCLGNTNDNKISTDIELSDVTDNSSKISKITNGNNCDYKVGEVLKY